MFIFQAEAQANSKKTAEQASQPQRKRSDIYGPKPTPVEIRIMLGPAANIYCSSGLVERLSQMDNAEDRINKIKEIQSAINIMKNAMPRAKLLDITATSLFFARPAKCAELSQACIGVGEKQFSSDVFFQLSVNPFLTNEFARDPQKVIWFFSDLIKKAGTEATVAISTISLEKGDDLNAAACLIDLFKNAGMTKRATENIQKPEPALEKRIHNDDKLAVWEWKKVREDEISHFSDLQIIGILISDQEFEYGSTFNYLFNQLDRIMKKKTLSLVELFKSHGIAEPEKSDAFRQIVFASINQGNFCSATSIVRKEDRASVLKMLAKPLFTNPLEVNTDNLIYLDKALGVLKENKDTKSLQAVYTEAASYYLALKGKAASFKGNNDYAKTMDALKYLAVRSNEKTDLFDEREKQEIAGFAPKSLFNLESHRAEDGVLRVIQVFDYGDTYESGHWGRAIAYCKSAFKNKPVVEKAAGKYEKYTFKDGDREMVLFLGHHELESQKFVSGYMGKNRNAIWVYRGHTGTLTNNMPPERLGNKPGNVTCVFGNCKSTQFILGYVATNPRTNLNIIANSGTGRGDVTNEIAMALLYSKGTIAYKDLLKSKQEEIAASKGSIDTLAVGGGGGVFGYIYREGKG